MTGTAQVTSLPEAARRQAARADEIHRQIYGEQPAAEAAPAPAPAAEAAPAPAPAAEAAPAPAPAAEAAPAPAPAAPAAPSDDDFQTKYNVLKGKYNREVPSLQADLRRVTSELEAMRSVIASMEATAAAAPAPAPAAPVPGFSTSGTSLITDADVEDFGEETIDMMRRAARAEAEQQSAGLLNRIAQLESQLQGVGREVQQTAREKLFSALDARVPNWKDINRDETFLTWLQESDPYSGVQRHALLMRAFEGNDAARVLRFFEGFLSEHAVLSEPQPAPTSERQPQVSLETLVAPGRPRSGPTRAQEGDGKRIWTPAEITAFYRDVQSKRYVGRDKERARIEQDIVAAAREGRVKASVNPF